MRELVCKLLRRAIAGSIGPGEPPGYLAARHLAACARCSQLREALLREDRDLRAALEAAPVPAPPWGLRSRVGETFAAGAASPGKSARRWPLRVACAGLALAALAVGWRRLEGWRRPVDRVRIELPGDLQATRRITLVIEKAGSGEAWP